jgi:putative cardiolipin synthase
MVWSRLSGAAAGLPTRLAPLLGALLVLLLAGCGSLPMSTAPVPSTALPAQADSPLARLASEASPAPDLSGLRLLPLGPFALDTRLQLVRRAVHSLDVQYYVLDNDSTGRLLLRQLYEAAARGVRVRLLVDDLYTTHTDALLRALAATPNVEVRLFNPFCCARRHGLALRFAASLFEIPRLDHRMHNKLLLADGAMAVAGGRNIADDYFLRGAEANFVDMDVLAVGAVVHELATIFDLYWNSPVVRPIQDVTPADGSAEDMRHGFEAATADTPTMLPLSLPEVDVLGYGPLRDDFEGGRLGLIWGHAAAIADPPDKLSRSAEAAFDSSLANQALMKIWNAKSEVTLTSPYLIPGPMGMESFRALGQRGVKVTVLTNSLAATDEPLVHTGYSRYRIGLIDSGVDLYELSPTRTRHNKRLGMFGSSLGRLHAKTAVVDGDKTFIGSMNLDPRSRTRNTELGVFIESPQLAREVLRVVKVSRLQSAYRVRRSPQTHQLQWLALDDEQGEVLLNDEPESSIWLKLHNWLLGWFVPEQLL